MRDMFNATFSSTTSSVVLNTPKKTLTRFEALKIPGAVEDASGYIFLWVDCWHPPKVLFRPLKVKNCGN